MQPSSTLETELDAKRRRVEFDKLSRDINSIQKSNVFKTSTGVFYLLRHKVSSDRREQFTHDFKRALQNIEPKGCRMCVENVSKYFPLEGPNGPVLFQRMITGCSQVVNDTKKSIEKLQNYHSEGIDVIIVYKDTFRPKEHSRYKGSIQDTGYKHLTVEIDDSEVTPDGKISQKLVDNYVNCQKEVEQILAKIITPECRNVFPLLQRALKESQPDRAGTYKACFVNTDRILRKFAKNWEEMTSTERLHASVEVLTYGNFTNDFHNTLYQVNNNFVDFVKATRGKTREEAKAKVIRLIEGRADPRTYQQRDVVLQQKLNSVKAGGFGVSLTWNGVEDDVDFDLYVLTPQGRLVNWANKLEPGEAKLNFDAGVCEGKAGVHASEDIDILSSGLYGIEVDNYSGGKPRNGNRPRKCEIFIRENGEIVKCIPVVWEPNRKQGERILVTYWEFDLKPKELSVSEKAERRLAKAKQEWESKIGKPKSRVATIDDLSVETTVTYFGDKRKRDEIEDVTSDIRVMDIEEEREPPEEFVCPITQDVMDNPVITPYGHNFEKVAISHWVEERGNCPLTRQGLDIEQLDENRVLKSLITQWCAKHHPSLDKPKEKHEIRPLQNYNGLEEMSLKELLKLTGDCILQICVNEEGIPGYYTVVETNTFTTPATPNMYYGRGTTPTLPTDTQCTAKIDTNWVQNCKWAEIDCIFKVGHHYFAKIKDAKLPQHSDFPLAAGCYPQNLPAEYHNLRDYWLMSHIDEKPRDFKSEEKLIGICLTKDFRVLVNGQMRTIRLS